MARKRAAAESIHDGDLWSDSEAILQAIEERDRTAVNPAMACCLQRAVGVLQSSDGVADKATFTIVTRDKTRNRHGNMVQIAPNELGGGLILDHYAVNPVVLFEHGMGGMSLAVGQSETPEGNLTVKLSKTKATADVYFSKMPHGRMIGAAVHEKILRMASIGFNPRKAMRLKPEKERDLPDGVEDLTRYQGMGLDFVESELMEWSITLIGADRGALRQSLDRGKIHDVALSPFMRQSLTSFVGDKPAWSPGWTPLPDGVVQRIPHQAAATEAAEGGEEIPDADEEEVEPVAVTQAAATQLTPALKEPDPAPVDNPARIETNVPAEPMVGIQQLADEFSRRQKHEPMVSLESLAGMLVQRVDLIVEQKLAPTLAAVGRLEKELHRMTGRVD